MSNIVLQPNASGTGNITIATPNTNTDRTLNIPDVAGDIVTTGDTGTVTGTMIGSLPVGSIVQVKQATATGNLGAGTQDLVSVSITPTDNTNKILVLGHTNAYVPAGSIAVVDIYRDTTFIYRSAIGTGWGAYAENASCSPVYLDNPTTTSAITYKLQGLHVSGSTNTSWNYYSASNTAETSITVMEVVV